MQSRRTLNIIIGDRYAWWHHFHEPYESLAKQYTSKNEVSGVANLYPSNWPNLVDKSKQQIDDYSLVFRNESSRNAFTTPMQPDSNLKLYILGHHENDEDDNELHSKVDDNSEGYFSIHIENISGIINKICNQVSNDKEEKTIKARPLEISLIVCHAGREAKYSFATLLADSLQDKGFNNVLIKARRGYVKDPNPFLGKITREGKKHIYICAKGIFQINAQFNIPHQFKKSILKLLNEEKVPRKKELLNTYLSQLNEMISNNNGLITNLDAMDEVVKLAGKFIELFPGKQVNKLKVAINRYNSDKIIYPNYVIPTQIVFGKSDLYWNFVEERKEINKEKLNKIAKEEKSQNVLRP